MVLLPVINTVEETILETLFKSTIQGEEIVAGQDDEAKSSSGAAKFADNQHRGDDARKEGWNEWEWWKFQDNGEWVELLSLTHLAG